MTKLFLLKLELFRKKFGIYGWWNILSLIAVLLIIFVSLKILFFKILPYESSMQLLTLLLVLSNIFVVTKEREELSKLAVKFQSFFYNFSRVEVLKYYTFRKYIILCILSVLLLFPLDLVFKSQKYFLFYMVLLQIFSLVSSLGSYFFKKKYQETVNLTIRIGFALFLALNVRKVMPFYLNQIIEASSVSLMLVLLLALCLINSLLLVFSRVKIWWKYFSWLLLGLS